jgi:hypothetical protein
MGAKLPALSAGRPLPAGFFFKIPGTYSARGQVDPRAIVRLEGLGKSEKKSTSLGRDPETFRFIAKCLNH